ncbi:chondroitin AC/alginate lyase [Penicillium canescens]|nr:chondroitin AC/alginate lyase [Penicillium canescens]
MAVMNEAAMGMTVFLEDAESYQRAMGLFKARVPATIYTTSDGEYPVAARGESSSPDAIVECWFDQDVFSGNEQAQETCRDLEHTGQSLASISHVVETARTQGDDLYKTEIGT